MEPDELLSWDMYFVAVVSMAFHPRTKLKMTLEDCARIADEMLELRRERCRFSVQ